MKPSTQTVDQGVKGGLLALLTYVLYELNVDPELILILSPLATALLACISSKFGNPEISSFLD